jgi:alpha-L-fucosidase 2
VLGDLLFQFKDTIGEITDYHRELDLETGIAYVSYIRNKKKVEYEVFSSSPDNVLVIRMKTDTREDWICLFR